MEDIVKDNILGSLEYKTDSWVRLMEPQILNSQNLKLVVFDPNKEGILNVQREAYKTYLQNEEKYKSCVTDLMLDYYKWNYEYIARIVSDLTENCHKDVVTEKEVLHMAPLWYLFICRDGSFGYEFGCCWDKENGIAVLLSESEPRVISRTQLENLHKLNDPTVGLLVHNGKNAWKGLEINSFFGKPENLEIELEGSAEEGITEAQQKAYSNYLSKKDEYFATMTKMLLSAYLGNTMLADEFLKADFGIQIGTVLPKTLFIDRNGNYGWICYTNWNKSYLGILLSSEKQSWLYVDELKSYSSLEKIEDKTFGVMISESSVWRKLDLCRFNKMVTASVYVRKSGTTITDAQRFVYQDYLSNLVDYRKKLKTTMLEYYHLFYDEFKEFMDIPEEMDKAHVNNENVLSILTFTDLMIDENARLAWLCQSPTENSGLAFEWTNGNVEWNTISGFMYGG